MVIGKYNRTLSTWIRICRIFILLLPRKNRAEMKNLNDSSLPQQELAQISKCLHLSMFGSRFGRVRIGHYGGTARKKDAPDVTVSVACGTATCLQKEKGKYVMFFGGPSLCKLWTAWAIHSHDNCFWSSWITGYHAKRDHKALNLKGQSVFQGKRDHVSVRLKRTKWLSG